MPPFFSTLNIICYYCYFKASIHLVHLQSTLNNVWVILCHPDIRFSQCIFEYYSFFFLFYFYKKNNSIYSVVNKRPRNET